MESEDETAGERTTRVGRPRGGMKVAARIGERLRRARDRKRQTPKGGRRLAPHTPHLRGVEGELTRGLCAGPSALLLGSSR